MSFIFTSILVVILAFLFTIEIASLIINKPFKVVLRKVKSVLYRTVSDDINQEWYSWAFDITLIVFILLTAIAIMLESVQELRVAYENYFVWFEKITILFFTLEYIIRMWTITEEEKYRDRFRGRFRYMFNWKSIIDLAAFLPFYFTAFPIDLRFIRVFRLFKIFKILKIVRYIRALHTITSVLKNKKEELVVSMSFVITLLIISSTFMYYIENEAQPDKFSSIPATLWWSAVTLTSVGYGDVYPITAMGKIFAGFISILGIALVSIPAGILASGFSEISTKK